MFSSVLISANSDRAALLRMHAAATGRLTILREYITVPGNYEFSRVLNAMIPDVVVLDLDLGPEVLDVGKRVREFSPHTAVIALAGLFTPALPPGIKQWGVNAIVPHGATTEEFQAALDDALHESMGGPEKDLICFLPAKAGSGASTLVLNVAAALARHGRRVLVVDADLRSSVLGILAGAPEGPSLQTVLASASELDQFVWQRATVALHGVDFLLSSRSLEARAPEWVHYFQVLNYARERYDVILVDLPELVNPATVELVRRARMIFPVCTPEIPSLKLTMQRVAELRRWHVDDDHLAVLVNRMHQTDPDTDRIDEMLHLKVVATFPNDYPLLKAAISEGVPVRPETPLGQAYEKFAVGLIGETYVAPKVGVTDRLKSIFRH